MKIATFNIRSTWKGKDSLNDFIHRVGLIYDKIQSEKPDVIAFQEIIVPQLELLQKMLPEYEFFGSFRENDYSKEGLFTAIKKDSVALMGGEIFWMSPTPFLAGSKFEHQKFPRVCIMCKIRNKATHEIFRVYNVHLDNKSEKARCLGLSYLFNVIDEYDRKEKIPTVLLGDFNARPHTEEMKMCYDRSDFTDVSTDIKTTFHGFGKTECKIDYIFVTDEWKNRTVETVAWTDSNEGIYLSDHYPVCLEIKD